MDYTYSPMGIDDYGEVFALWESFPGVGLSEADSYDGIAGYLSRNPGQSFVCKTGGRIVGTILCGNDGRRAYIHHTAVAAEHRRHGIASELVRLAMSVQKENGIQKCHLFVFCDNEPGKAFWREAGFSDRTDIEIMSMGI
jgi:ribosomal protein S18 acetylase RimI-like enzyme